MRGALLHPGTSHRSLQSRIENPGPDLFDPSSDCSNVVTRATTGCWLSSPAPPAPEPRPRPYEIPAEIERNLTEFRDILAYFDGYFRQAETVGAVALLLSAALVRSFATESGRAAWQATLFSLDEECR